MVVIPQPSASDIIETKVHSQNGRTIITGTMDFLVLYRVQTRNRQNVSFVVMYIAL